MDVEIPGDDDMHNTIVWPGHRSALEDVGFRIAGRASASACGYLRIVFMKYSGFMGFQRLSCPYTCGLTEPVGFGPSNPFGESHGWKTRKVLNPTFAEPLVTNLAPGPHQVDWNYGRTFPPSFKSVHCVSCPYEKFVALRTAAICPRATKLRHARSPQMHVHNNCRERALAPLSAQFYKFHGRKSLS